MFTILSTKSQDKFKVWILHGPTEPNQEKQLPIPNKILKKARQLTSQAGKYHLIFWYENTSTYIEGAPPHFPASHSLSFFTFVFFLNGIFDRSKIDGENVIYPWAPSFFVSSQGLDRHGPQVWGSQVWASIFRWRLLFIFREEPQKMIILEPQKTTIKKMDGWTWWFPTISYVN